MEDPDTHSGPIAEQHSHGLPRGPGDIYLVSHGESVAVAAAARLKDQASKAGLFATVALIVLGLEQNSLSATSKSGGAMP